MISVRTHFPLSCVYNLYCLWFVHWYIDREGVLSCPLLSAYDIDMFVDLIYFFDANKS